MSKIRHITAADILIIVLTAAAAIYAGFSLYGGKPVGERLIVEVRSERWIYPLDQDMTISVPGPLGITTVVIENKAVRISDSPCPNKTCVASRPLSQTGDWSACLPNEVLIRIDGATASDEFDGLAQ